MKRYSYSAVAAATGYGREALALYGKAHGWNPARGIDLSQVVDFMKAMQRKSGHGRVDPAEVEDLRAVLLGAGLLG